MTYDRPAHKEPDIERFIVTTEGDDVIIHAMRLRPIYKKLLDP